MNNLGVTALSLALTTIVVGNAYYQKKQFYPSVVYITKSNPSMAVMYVQALNIVLLVGKLMKRIFFGELRAAEFEHLIERSWYAVTETCLAFTVFRDDFSPKFVALFILLFFLKAFHWLAEDRVDFMERSPAISFVFHLRIITLLCVLATFDCIFVELAYQTLTKGASVQLVFGFEYAILLTIVANIAIKYVLHSFDLHSEVPWENKAVFLLYTELVMGLIKVVLYFLFVMIMVRIYTLPLFAFRPMYYTLRAFKKAFNDVILSRRAIRNMNTLYPDATPEELAAADNVCIICREDMLSASKKLPCNHIFHTACLRSWFQRQQTCPTCRLNILRTPTNGTQQPNPEPQRQDPGAPRPNRNRFMRQMGDQQNRGNEAPSTSAGSSGAQQGPGTPQAGPSGSSGPGPSSGDGSFSSPGGQFPIPPFFAPFSNSSNGGGQPFNFDEFPYLCPPFPLFPFGVPPPMPPFERLSEEELRQMERNNRAGIEARLACLQNIQRLLDASVIMMQQYTAAATARYEILRNIGTQTEEEDFSNHEPDLKSESRQAETVEDSPAVDSTIGPSTSRGSQTAAMDEGNDEASVLRKRRLARFTQQANGSSS